MAVADEVLGELRAAARSLRRSPGYVLTVVATLALASGGNLTMFGIADGLTFRPLKYLRAPQEVHRVYWQWTDNGQRTTSAATHYTRAVDLARDAGTLADVAVFAERTLPVGDGVDAQQRQVATVSASYFRFFDAAPARGRFFDVSEDLTPRGADVVVLGYRFWRSQFGGVDVLGRTLRVGDVRATIIGVAPEGFDGLNDGRPAAVFLPITTYAASTGTDDARTYFTAYKWGWVHLLVRRAPGVDVSAATADATRSFVASWPRFVADNPGLPVVEGANPQVLLASLRLGAGPMAGADARTALWLLGVAGAVLLLGCANIANLALSRALARRREVSVKRALGISAWRLRCGVFAEAAMLACGGGAAALAVAHLTRLALAPTLAPLRVPDVSVIDDARVLTATALLVVTSAILTGVVPAVMLGRPGARPLGASPRGATAEGRRTRAVLLAAQAMLSVTLLVGAGLFLRSLLAVQSASLGYDPRQVLVVNRSIPPGGFDVAAQTTLRDTLLRAAAAVPEVESVAWMSSAPFVSTSSTDLHVPETPNATTLGPFTFQATTADYFRTMGTRILRGRGLRADDTSGAPAVAVVSDSMARTLWPGRDAIGRCFHMRTPDTPCREVVGVAEDMVQRDLAGGARLHYYVPIDQYPRTFGNGLLVKVRGDPGRADVALRAALQRVLPPGAYLSTQPLGDLVVVEQRSWRIGATVLVAFGLLSLVVAGVGLFGGVSYDIAQRSREWAVRVALGANRRAIVRLIVGRSLAVVAAGVVPGLLAAVAFGRWIQPLLYRTSAFDGLSFGVAATLMALVAIVASAWPALVAARTDPSRALQAE